MSILAWLGLTAPPDPVTVATREWLGADREARAEVSAREQLAAAQCREAAARYELRQFHRMYGRASETIGAQRGMLARVRSHRDELDELLEHVAVALGCGPDPTAAWFRDVAARAGALLAADSKRLLTYLRDTPIGPVDEQRAADEALVEAMQRHPSGRATDPADTAEVRDEMPEGWPADRRDDDDVCDIPSPDRFVCTRPTGHAGQHVATAGGQVCEVWPNKHRPDVIERAEQYGHEIGQRDRTAAVEGAAITLRAHLLSGVRMECSCGCGINSYDEYARHVAEQLAVVGALGTFPPMAALPVLVDRDGDEWPLVTEEAVYRAPNPDLGHHTRAEIERMWGPVTEKAAHPVPRPAWRTGSFRLGPARGLADGGD